MLRLLRFALTVATAHAACPGFDVNDADAASATRQLMGGYTEWRASDAAFEKRIGATLEDLEQRVKSDFAELSGSDVAYPSKTTICQYRSQVVAGTNYNVLVSAGEMTYSVKIYEPLPYTKLPAKITSFERLQ